MKKLFATLFAVVAFVAVAIAQTPQEIVSRMETEMGKLEKQGVVMMADAKIPIFGTMTTKTYTLGDKSRSEGAMLGVEIVTWSDGETIWEYKVKENQVQIENARFNTKSDSNGDLGLFSGITEGYDVSIDKETATEWNLLCKKSKSNTDKDAPQKIELVIAKGTYVPVTLITKVEGIKITMYDITFGVTEEEVTFNADNYPGVTVVDKRQ